ncbi:MAG: S-methyl-5'-thioadenosine phosphorylase [Deltaproteobacteria bacterium]|nr:S-methyl-5'-thioadenosine phosphorylase [Deltaproteobacteria bacterium]
MGETGEKGMLGVIGGSGLYSMDGLVGATRVRVETPFGEPSDAYVVGTVGGRRVAFLPRHGAGHRILPSELNFRANIYGFKKLGADAIVSVSAVGSLREEIAPGHIVVPDQLLDRTRGRISTFFGDGIVAHVGFADPFCGPLSDLVAGGARSLGATVHRGGTYVCMEGPQFSTRAESHLYRSQGAHIIGMTSLQEAKLAREAEICFATMALATDYDCWREGEEAVEIEKVLAVLAANVDLARKTVALVAGGIDDARGCGCRRSLDHAVITARAAIPQRTRDKLAVILGRLGL